MKNKKIDELESRLEFLEDLYFNDIINARIEAMNKNYDVKINISPITKNAIQVYYELNYPTNRSFSLFSNKQTKKDFCLWMMGPVEDELKSMLYERRIKNVVK